MGDGTIAEHDGDLYVACPICGDYITSVDPGGRLYSLCDEVDLHLLSYHEGEDQPTMTDQHATEGWWCADCGFAGDHLCDDGKIRCAACMETDRA